MKLVEALAQQFGSADRQRGRALTDNVEITAVGTDGALGLVQGSADEPYVVGIDLQNAHDHFIEVHCECPRFDDAGCCKHLFAMILVLDEVYPHADWMFHKAFLLPGDSSKIDVGWPLNASHKRGPARTVDVAETTRKRTTKKRASKTKAAEKEGVRKKAAKEKTTKKKTTTKKPARSRSASSVSAWKKSIRRVASQIEESTAEAPSYTSVYQRPPAPTRTWYAVGPGRSAAKTYGTPPSEATDLRVQIYSSNPKQKGGWSKPVPQSLAAYHPVDEPDAVRTIGRMTNRAPRTDHYRWRPELTEYRLVAGLITETLSELAHSGRCVYKTDGTTRFGDPPIIRRLDADRVYPLHLSVMRDPDNDKRLRVAASLDGVDAQLVDVWDDGIALTGHPHRSNDESIDGQMRYDDLTFILVDPDHVAAIRAWQDIGAIQVPRRSLSTLIRELSESFAGIPIRWDKGLEVSETTETPSPVCHLVTDPPDRPTSPADRYNHRLRHTDSKTPPLRATLSMRYPSKTVPVDSSTRWWMTEDRVVVRRDAEAEGALIEKIPGDAFIGDPPRLLDERLVGDCLVDPARLIEFVGRLTEAGWEVTAEGKKVRSGGQFNVTVSSGIDWFDVAGEMNFDDISVGLPAILAAARRGQTSIVLDDGTVGMLPEDWIRRHSALIELADDQDKNRSKNPSEEHPFDAAESDDSIRVHRSRALLLDAMLDDLPDVHRDADFTHLCRNLHDFGGVGPIDAPETFQGALRDYQKWGVGWLGFLRDFGFGGCLADDMGLGKTIQVLAMLQHRAGGDAQGRPSLVVAPKSLVFNWVDEARRFTPDLRVLNHTGTDRDQAWMHDGVDRPFDVVVTTYGTMRNDIASLRGVEFDYVILDESQAIKNPESQSAKAARLLSATHRLAMTGTPVENHLGDLWSLFEFLNPGMLRSGMIKGAESSSTADDQQRRDQLQRVSQSLRPFILRRTKEEVLTELPAKSEQTLTCQMSVPQKKRYDETRRYYQQQLAGHVEAKGLKRSKIHVLEALLRLRQIACDPRLVDADCGVRGSKLDMLLQQIVELIASGHKALVFSQFTSMLALLRSDLDARGITYEYLDGRTRKRQQKVERFQSDDACPLFLISLKAGGSGLNLTAADYVFILDPWWNPAVEAQAIDRAHRMGQERSVMAYRMICEGTVEEKIIELQRGKRELADAIVSADKSLIGSLTAEDLEALLS